MNCIVPKTITAGLSLSVVAQLPSYSNGWDAFLYLRGPSSLDIQASQLGNAFTFAVPAAITAAWVPGEYAYTLRVTDGFDVLEIDAGRLKIAPDLTNVPEGYDPRTPAQIGLDAIEAVLAKRATIDQERYRINNRELYRTPIADLMKLRAFYKEQVRKECCNGRNIGFGEIRVGMRPIGR